MLYITLLDQFHPGIYSSQVIDVCNFLNKKYNAKIRLVAFLSIKELIRSDSRKKIKHLSENSIILPAFPGLKYFEFTSFFLLIVCFLTGERVAVCRNAFATKIALRIKKYGLLKQVVLDARSALNAEIKEFDVFPVKYLRNNIFDIEKYAVNNSDFRIVVSNKLVKYWEKNYNYQIGREVVIPCTLDNKFFSSSEFIYNESEDKIRDEFSLKTDDILLVYAGSTAPWQSFELIDKLLSPLLSSNENVKVLFLSREDEKNLRFKDKFKERVFIKWLSHKSVLSYLRCCDYGILLRDQSETNQVASPVKFAEYLYSGLPVLITENLGDFSDYVRVNDCGHVINEQKPEWGFLNRTNLSTRLHCFELAKRDFLKDSSNNSILYYNLWNYLNSN